MSGRSKVRVLGGCVTATWLALAMLAAARPRALATPRAVSIDPRAARCGDCHAEQYDEWAASMHRQSATDRFYVAAQRLDQEPFCDACHAPRGTSEAARLDDGVDCASCHLRDGAILASRVTEAAQRAHPMRASSELSSSRSCAGCHEFRAPSFERGLGLREGTFMQRTLTEHERSPAAARGATCQSCHMPGGDHRTLGLRDPRFVANALEVRGQARLAPDYGILVDVTLTAHDVGHAFPTGDMLRALEVRVLDGTTTRTETLSRVFRVTSSERHRVEVDDSRLLPEAPRTLTFHLPTRPASVMVQINLLRAPLHDARSMGMRADDLRVPVQTIEMAVLR